MSAQDFHWVLDDLAIGGRFPAHHAPALVQDHAIRAVVDLREEECDDADALERAGMRFLHLPTPDLKPVELGMLDQGVRFAGEHLERGERVLIHCQHGIGRSAMLALCVMVDHGMEPLEALCQAKQRRLCVSPSPSQFEGWANWLRRGGHRPPSYDSFAAVAYAHLR